MQIYLKLKWSHSLIDFPKRQITEGLLRSRNNFVHTFVFFRWMRSYSQIQSSSALVCMRDYRWSGRDSDSHCHCATGMCRFLWVPWLGKGCNIPQEQRLNSEECFYLLIREFLIFDQFCVLKVMNMISFMYPKIQMILIGENISSPLPLIIVMSLWYSFICK